MLSVTKKFDFCYGHCLPGHKGKCKNTHGHNSTLEVELVSTETTDKMNIYDGMIIDFGDLKNLVKETIIDRLDHQYLNEILEVNPTAENLVKWTVRELQNVFGKSLVRVRIYETPDSYAEWRL
jgi:6-pyruvoyltetrahydropterin/6-carboxytetrahydropterin synthase